MTKNALWLKIENDRLPQALQEAAASLDDGVGEAVLDLSSVARIDAKSLAALADLAGIADSRGVKVALHGINVDVYKVLKLMRLTQRFSFMD